ncbi:MAG: rRNA methyltransferase [Acidimicrobiales bacterium mtb01]|nr:RNA methyltransferase [Actinomycetota bacterium]TEX45605.1 MAG: rRNA methyltransferase [Acidimicrobiales bacterium mtb01]
MSDRYVVVDSPDDPRLDQFRLRERELRPKRVPARVTKNMPFHEVERVASGSFVAEGDLVVERALAAGCQVQAVLTDADEPASVCDLVGDDVPMYAATSEARRMLTGLGVALDVIALFERPSSRALPDVVRAARHVLVLEDVDNPTNVGAIVRSAVALGAHGLILDRNSADPLSRRALRVSMGTALSLPTARVDDLGDALAALKSDGFTSFGLTPAPDSLDLDEAALAARGRLALVMGSERDGLSGRLMAAVDHRVRIPMSEGVDSLNVAAAAAVACYALLGRSRTELDD